MSSRRHLHAALFSSSLLLSACGGGGGGGSTPIDGNIPPSSQSAQQCAPSNEYAATHNGSLAVEKQWVRSYMNEAYLWYDEVPQVNVNDAAYNDGSGSYSLYMYFNALRVSSKDRFSFMYPTDLWNKLAGDGVELGYGIEWVQKSDTPPRGIRIGYVQPNSPAASAGLRRGDTLLNSDGVTADDASAYGEAWLQEAMYPSNPLQLHGFLFARAGAENVFVTFQPTDVTKTPVPLVKVITASNGDKVGYLVFHDHLAPAEAQLIAAINQLKAANVTDLVLDIRYNGGGYIYIASQLAYMIAGPARTGGKVFEQYTYNAKRAAESNSADSRLEFLNQSSSEQPLPTLNLSRVHVITTGDTCSASEAIINGLRGANVEVRQIGSTTCGKPYGFTAKDNCGISYFPIEFKGVNDKSFGDYASGFVPGGSGDTGLPGCSLADDLGKPLGDVTEGLLSAALAYRSSGSCAPAAGLERPQALHATAPKAFMHRNPLRENRVLRP